MCSTYDVDMGAFYNCIVVFGRGLVVVTITAFTMLIGGVVAGRTTMKTPRR